MERKPGVDFVVSNFETSETERTLGDVVRTRQNCFRELCYMSVEEGPGKRCFRRL